MQLFKRLISIYLISVVHAATGLAQTDSISTPFRLLELKLDNDFIYLTDQYYSNGVFIGYQSSELKKTPVKWLTPTWSDSKQYQGFKLSQYMFTPTNIDEDTILIYDRPYCGLLLFNNSMEQYLMNRGLKLTSSIGIGLIGNWSYAQEVQDAIHNTIPTSTPAQGWDHQIQGDIAVNYEIQAEARLFELEYIDQFISSQARVGLPFTDITAGSTVRIGLKESYFYNPGLRTRKDLQCYWHISGEMTAKFYDATLQGGLFNRDNVHTVAPSSLVLSSRTGIVLNYRGIAGGVGIQYVSPGFEYGNEHRWAYAELKFVW